MKECKHIAFIMDGNRRWAKTNNFSKLYGHKVGCEKLKEIVFGLPLYGISVATVYAFSYENWNRPEYEVGYLMNLFEDLFENSFDEFNNKGYRVTFIGNLSMLSKKMNEIINRIEDITRENSVFTLVIALSYSARDEILRAVKKILNEIKDNEMDIEKIDEKLFEKHLDTAGLPDPDIIVRTSEKRLSNFLLWQSAYSELFFIDKFWPEFSLSDVKCILDEYQQRERRYGV